MTSMVLPPPLLKVTDVVIDIRPLPDAKQTRCFLEELEKIKMARQVVHPSDVSRSPSSHCLIVRES